MTYTFDSASQSFRFLQPSFYWVRLITPDTFDGLSLTKITVPRSPIYNTKYWHELSKQTHAEWANERVHLCGPSGQIKFSSWSWATDDWQELDLTKESLCVIEFL